MESDGVTKRRGGDSGHCCVYLEVCFCYAMGSYV